MPYLAYLFNL